MHKSLSDLGDPFAVYKTGRETSPMTVSYLIFKYTLKFDLHCTKDQAQRFSSNRTLSSTCTAKRQHLSREGDNIESLYSRKETPTIQNMRNNCTCWQRKNVKDVNKCQQLAKQEEIIDQTQKRMM